MESEAENETQVIVSQENDQEQKENEATIDTEVFVSRELYVYCKTNTCNHNI